MSAASRIRVGLAPGVDAAVAAACLERRPERFSIQRCASSSELAAAVDDSDVDVALLPVHLLSARADRLEVVPGMGAGSDGASGTMKLEAFVPLPDVRRVQFSGCDHVADVVCNLLFLSEGIVVESVLDKADARVLVDEQALGCANDTALDLGHVWHELTGLPFVRALWVGRPGIVDRTLYADLHAVRAWSRQRIQAAVARLSQPAARSAAVDAAKWTDFLQERLSGRLGRREIESVERFWHQARRNGLIDGTEPMQSVPLAAQTSCHQLAKTMARGRGGQQKSKNSKHA